MNWVTKINKSFRCDAKIVSYFQFSNYVEMYNCTYTGGSNCVRRTRSRVKKEGVQSSPLTELYFNYWIPFKIDTLWETKNTFSAAKEDYFSTKKVNKTLFFKSLWAEVDKRRMNIVEQNIHQPSEEEGQPANHDHHPDLVPCHRMRVSIHVN